MLKSTLKTLLSSLGYEIKKVRHHPPGSDTRPIAELGGFFEDLSARNFKISKAMDCGANDGEWTLELLGVFPEASVLMVEPQNSKIKTYENIAVKYPSIDHEICGVGEKDELKIFSQWQNDRGSNFLDTEKPEDLKNGVQVKKQVHTIPTILEKHKFGIPDLIKMDVQGSELPALKGLGSLIQEIEVFVLECNLFSFLPEMPIANDIIEYLYKNDIVIYDVCGYGRRPHDGAVSHLDIVFAQKNGKLRNYQGW